MTLNIAGITRKTLFIACICALIFSIIIAAPASKQAYAETPDKSEGMEEIAKPDSISYNLWVGGVQVTDSNAEDVLGDETVSYDSDKRTLVLKGATIGKVYPEYNAYIYADLDSLTIEWIGSTSISDQHSADNAKTIYTTGNLTLVGSQKLEALAGSGIVAKGTIFIGGKDGSAANFDTRSITSLQGDVIINKGSNIYVSTLSACKHAIYAGSSIVVNGGDVGVNLLGYGDDTSSALFARKSVSFNGGLVYCCTNGEGSVVDCGDETGLGTIVLGRNMRALCYDIDEYGQLATRKVDGKVYSCIVRSDGVATREASIYFDEHASQTELDKPEGNESKTAIDDDAVVRSASGTLAQGRSSKGQESKTSHAVLSDDLLNDGKEPPAFDDWRLLTVIHAASAIAGDESLQTAFFAKGGLAVAKGRSAGLSS